jgi:hypothetical protein
LFEDVACDHGVAREGSGKFQILFPAGGVFGDGEIVSLQAPAAHVLGVFVLHEHQPIAPTFG